MSQVDQVKSAADIVKIVGDYVKLRKAGTNYTGLCPFHQEKTPSFAVHPVKQIFHCFGCGVGGDVLKFVMLIDNLTFPEALRRVAEKVGVRLKEQEFDETADANARERTALYKIHDAAAKYFAAQLGATTEGRSARAYLADRGLSDEVVGRFRIGFAPSDGQSLTRVLQEAGFKLPELEKSGLVLRNAESQRHFDRFRRRVIFPISNESGKVVAFGGRALGDDMPKYLNSPETPIYAKSRVLYHLDRAAQSIRKLDYVILVEGYMDCIAVASAGVENVVASCGTSLTESQIRLLTRYTRRVIVNYDPDSAGVAATERSLNLLLEEGFEAKVLALPGGLDPDSFIRKQGAAAYKELLGSAPTYLDYLTDRAAAQHDVSRPEGKIAAANFVMTYLVRVPNPMLRAELANRLAERLRVDNRLLREELKRAAGESRPQIKAPEKASEAKMTLAERQLLRAVLESEAMADEILPAIAGEELCAGLGTEQLFKKILEAREQGETIEVSRIEEWGGSEGQRMVFGSLFDSGEPPDSEQVRSCLLVLRRRKIERQRDQLQIAIEAAERAQDSLRLSQLLQDKARLMKELSRFGRARDLNSQSVTE
jgi:DNA primase